MSQCVQEDLSYTMASREDAQPSSKSEWKGVCELLRPRAGEWFKPAPRLGTLPHTGQPSARLYFCYIAG